MSLLPIVASADAVEIDGIYYNLVNKLKTAEVTRNPNGYSGNIVIPDTVESGGVKYAVTRIGNLSFFYSDITSITIPRTIKSIGEEVFINNFNFNAIYITDLEAWCKIVYDEGEIRINPLQRAEHLFLNGTEIIDLVIPSSVEVISDMAFQGGINFKSITIPEGVKIISDNTFSGCSGVISVTMDNTVEAIGNNAFYGCSSLSSVTIPNSLTSIGSGAFSECSSLSSVTIPNSLTSIGSGAFYGCSSLSSVTIPSSVTTIGDGAFNSCSSLTSITIPNSLTSIGSWTFNKCTKLSSVSIPSSVTSIGSYAFYRSGLTTLTIPNSVTSIGSYAFSGCSNLETIILGSGIELIFSKAFASCPELKDVYSSSLKLVGLNDYFVEWYTSSDAFDDSYIEYATLHVPEEAMEEYKSITPWSNFGTIVSLDGTALHELTVSVDNRGTVTYGESLLTDGTQTFNVKEGTDVVLTLTAEEGYKLASVTVDGVDKTADVVDGVLTISNVTADLEVNVKFATAGETVAATIGSAGMATFCSTSDLDFSEVDGLTAYTGAGFNRETGVLTMLKVTDAPAGTGLVLTGGEGTYEVPVKTSASIYANLLVGVTEETTLSQTDGGYVNYILSNGSHGVSFYIVSGEGQLAAGKAYLRLPAVVAGESRAISITFADDATGIEGISGESKTTTDEWRDLQGRRIMQPTKAGIYLKDGRKIVVR